jgi:lysyl-tRNA synthetase class II
MKQFEELVSFVCQEIHGTTKVIYQEKEIDFWLVKQPAFLETPKMAAVPRKILKSPLLNLKKETDRITLAIDRLFHGF